MTDEYCPKCSHKMIWSEQTTGNDFVRESACPICLTHIRVSNGSVQITRPENKSCEHLWEKWRYGFYRCCRCQHFIRESPEPRKPREWRLLVDKKSYGVYGVATEFNQDHPSSEIVRVREVIE